jgi:hypothetical protein
VGTWYEFKGELVFATADDAKAALKEITSEEDSVFFVPESFLAKQRALVVKGRKLVFKDGDFTSGESFYKAVAALGRILERAVGGRVRVQDGEGKGARVEWYGWKPKKRAKKK